MIRKFQRKTLVFGISLASISVTWLYLEIRKTRLILQNAFDRELLLRLDMDSVMIPVDPYIYIDKTNRYNPWHLIQSLSNRLRFEYSLRVANMTKSDVKEYRMKATKTLSELEFLESFDYQYLAQRLDAQTTVALARIQNSDPRLFTLPPNRHIPNYLTLMSMLKDLLTRLNESSRHPCLPYCLEKVFQDDTIIFDDDSTSREFYKELKVDAGLILLLRTILHHTDLKNNAKDLIKLRALPLLMEVYEKYSTNREISIILAHILCNISIYPEAKEEIFHTGWIRVLATWSKHPNTTLSTMAAKTLANLDSDSGYGMYSKSVYLLHPFYRRKVIPKVDVVVVHGLLGGVFFTWRQQDRIDFSVGLFGKKHEKISTTPNKQKDAMAKGDHTRLYKESCLETKDYHSKIAQCMEDDCVNVGRDYETVMYDLPVESKNDEPNNSFTYQDSFQKFQNEIYDHCATSECWPKTWLSKDCNNIRVLGLDYETSLSMWAPVCPEKQPQTLNFRSEQFREDLKAARVGDRPILWICHSMGGLIVKKILTEAMHSSDEKDRNLARNTAGIVFCSTPHKGSPVAVLKEITKLLVWPTVEVQELRENSPHLLELQKNFEKYLMEQKVKIISMVENKPTDVSSMRISYQFVTKESADLGIGEFYLLPLNHLSICKPKNRNSFIYQRILKAVHEICDCAIKS